MKRSVDIVKILNHYGRENQKLKTLEEMAELQVAITHNVPPIAVVSELADVYIMLEQLRLMYSISEQELEREINFKVNRQLKRMEEDK